MNTKFYPQWLRLTAVLALLLAALASASPAYADTCLVTSNADSGAGSLREKIADPVCDTLTFDGDYTIVLASNLTIDRNVTIDGVGHGVTVSGNHAVRAFEVRQRVDNERDCPNSFRGLLIHGLRRRVLAGDPIGRPGWCPRRGRAG